MQRPKPNKQKIEKLIKHQEDMLFEDEDAKNFEFIRGRLTVITLVRRLVQKLIVKILPSKIKMKFYSEVIKSKTVHSDG